MIFWDTHMHSEFSFDAEAPQEDMIKAAIAKGLAGICFTEHLDLDYPEVKADFPLDLNGYRDSVTALKEKYKDTLPIRFGVELGLQPHLKQRLEDILSQYGFDFVIGSSHMVHGRDPYYPAYFEGRSDHDSFIEYFRSIPENISAFDNFDVYGHLDYVVRYAPEQNAHYSYLDYMDLIDEILTALISRGKGIEINTAGFKYGLGHPNPTEGIIKRYRELGGEIITVGADAHVPDAVGYDFEKLSGILSDAGFKYFTVFEKRKPTFIKIE